MVLFESGLKTKPGLSQSCNYSWNVAKRELKTCLTLNPITNYLINLLTRIKEFKIETVYTKSKVQVVSTIERRKCTISFALRITYKFVPSQIWKLLNTKFNSYTVSISILTKYASYLLKLRGILTVLIKCTSYYSKLCVFIPSEKNAWHSRARYKYLLLTLFLNFSTFVYLLGGKLRYTLSL